MPFVSPMPWVSASSSPLKAWWTRSPSAGCLQHPPPWPCIAVGICQACFLHRSFDCVVFTALKALLCDSHHIHPPTVFLNGSVGKEFACNAGDTRDVGLIPVSGRSSGGGNGNPLQYSCLESKRLQGVGHGWVTQKVSKLLQISSVVTFWRNPPKLLWELKSPLINLKHWLVII